MPVLPRSLEIQGEIAAIRRDIHAHPELAYEEARTSDIVAAKLTEAMVARTRKLTLGDGLDPKVEIGPVINRPALERIQNFVQLGQKEGARPLA